MADKLYEIVLRANTALFAQKVCQIIRDMTDIHYMIEANSLNKSLFTYPGGFICFVHFAGTIQGDYFLALDETTAARMCNCADTELQGTALRKKRTLYAGFIAELLNTAIGRSIPELEKKFGPLTITPPMKIFGELEFPKVVAGNVVIKGEPGNIQCTLALNMTSLKIIKKLVSVPL